MSGQTLGLKSGVVSWVLRLLLPEEFNDLTQIGKVKTPGRFPAPADPAFFCWLGILNPKICLLMGDPEVLLSIGRSNSGYHPLLCPLPSRERRLKMKNWSYIFRKC